MKAAAMVLLLPCLAGCAFDEGTPFGLVTGSIEARYDEVEARKAGDGWQRLDNDLEIHVTELSLEVEEIELVALAENAAPTEPAEEEHCHGNDCGEAAEEPAPVGEEVLLTMMHADDLDLLAPRRSELTCVGPCAVSPGHATRVHVVVGHMHLAIEVRDGLDPPRFEGPLPVELEDVAALLEAEVDLPFDHDHEPNAALALTLSFDAVLFDGAVSVDAQLPNAVVLDEVRLRETLAEWPGAAVVTRESD
jgi:hypothetical protein